jgi:hypothetical protein
VVDWSPDGPSTKMVIELARVYRSRLTWTRRFTCWVNWARTPRVLGTGGAPAVAAVPASLLKAVPEWARWRRFSAGSGAGTITRWIGGVYQLFQGEMRATGGGRTGPSRMGRVTSVSSCELVQAARGRMTEGDA